eukprot:COSAG02_NODE_802_length_17030_cov_37.485500_20_plen_68_part_00
MSLLGAHENSNFQISKSLGARILYQFFFEPLGLFTVFLHLQGRWMLIGILYDTRLWHRQVQPMTLVL